MKKKKLYSDNSLPLGSGKPYRGSYLNNPTVTDVRLKDEYVVVQFYPWLIYFISLRFWVW